MAALSTSLSSFALAITGVEALPPHVWDSIATFGLAAGLVVCAAVVLACLPWTDQQLSQTDREARTVLRRVSQAAASRAAASVAPQRRRGLAVVVPRSS